MQPQRPVERKQPQEETIEYHIGLHRNPQARSPYVAAMNVQNFEELKLELCSTARQRSVLLRER